MTKRIHYDNAIASEIEDWGVICNRLFEILHEDGRTTWEKIEICQKAKRKMAIQWLRCHSCFEAIWRMRWERFDRFEEGLNFSIVLDCMNVML